MKKEIMEKYTEREQGFIEGLEFGFKILKDQYEFALNNFEEICKKIKK